jgi:hypothetical protein
MLNTQASRYLLKQVKKAKSGKKCEGLFAYINNLESLKKSKSTARNVEEFCSLDHLDQAMAVNTASQL